jgi:hypothetical protein
MKSEAGKSFAGFYPLYSGLAFLVLAGLLFGPVAHRHPPPFPLRH